MMKVKRHRKLPGKSKRRIARTRPTVEPDGFVRDAKRNPTNGRVGLGNSLAAKPDGLNRFQKKRELPEEVRLFVDAFRADVESDQGGASELTAIRGGYVRRLTDVEAMLQLAAKDIRTRGFFTVGGRTRTTVFTFMQLLDRWDRLAQRLGLDRRTKPVTDIALALRDAEDRR
jgi:hypothetical protein